VSSPDDPTLEPRDDLAVTEVSNEVLEELSSLFAAPTAAVIPHDPTDDTAPVVVVHEEDVVVIGDAEPVADEQPVDPLLRPISGDSDVMEISDDSGGTVVIDVDEVDRVVIVDNDRPDPTFEERRRRYERRERLKKVKWFKLAGVGVAGLIIVLAILASPLFAIRSVTFEGTVYTSDKTIADVRSAMEGVSFFTVDTAQARQKMLSDPWVADVRITTHFSGRALVEVSERDPVVWYVGDDEKVRIVDARGVVVAVLDGWPTS